MEAFIGNYSIEELAKGDDAVVEAVNNYKAAKARMEGIQEKFQQTREQQYEESDRSIQANDNNGMVYATQLKDEPVYITGGNVVLNEDGTIDVDNSSETLYVKFPDGHVEMTSPDKFTEVFTSDRTADLKAAKRAEIDAKWKAEFDTAEAQSVEQEKREAGVVFNMTDAQGEHRIEILNEGEEMSDILLDGAQMEIPTEELNRWKQEAGIQSTDNRVQSADAVADNTTDNVAPTGDNVAPVTPVDPKQRKAEVLSRITMKGKQRMWTEANPADVAEYISLLTEDPAKRMAVVDGYIAKVQEAQAKAEPIEALEMDEQIAFWNGIKEMLAPQEAASQSEKTAASESVASQTETAEHPSVAAANEGRDTVGGSPVALAYLLEGGQGSILNAGYFLHGVAAAFPAVSNEIETLRGAMSEDVLGMSPTDFVAQRADEIAQIGELITNAYGEAGAAIYNELLNNASGFVPRVGAEVGARIEALQPLGEPTLSQTSDQVGDQVTVPEGDAPGQSGVLLSDEVDENGRQFVLNSKGEIAFGEILEDSGLTPAPILLSEGLITNPATNDGYGLVHIEARHGDQIRNAGYNSVVEFVEEVAKNYEVIREGKDRNGQQTYMLQLTDKHNNTLMVELSGDGTYWNINTAGIFKTSYGKNRKEVYNRHTTAKQPTETVEASQDAEQSGTQAASSMNAPTTSSASEDRNSVSNSQENVQESGEIAENGGENAKSPMQELADQILDRAEEKRRIPLRERARELEAQVGVKANIIESLDEVKNREARERIAAGEPVAGWYSGGQVYLYMPNMKDRREIELTYVHEVVAHHGVKKLLGERFNEFLDGVWNMMSEADRARMLAYVGANENPTLQDMRAAADEYVAELAEKMNLGELEQSTWEKIVDWFKELLENIGFENLTKEDIESMLKASYANLAKGGNGIESRAYVKETMRTAPLRKRAEKWMKDTGVPVRLIGIGDETTNRAARRAINAGEKVTGWIDNNEVVLYLPNISNEKEIDDTFVHEVVAHKGLKALMGKDFDALCDKVWEMMSEEQRAHYLDYPGVNGDTRKAADEYMAHLAEGVDLTEQDKTVWQRIVEAVRAFLVKHGMKMTDGDIENLIRASYSRLKGESRNEKGEIQFRIAEVNERFNNELQQQIDGTLPKGHIYELGMPSEVLRSAGLPNLPIELAASRLSDKSMQENHPFELSEIKGLVEAVQEPLAVFRSATRLGSFVVLTEIQHEGRNYVVAIETNRDKGRIQINSVRSIHYRNSNKHIANWIEEGLLEYADKKRMSEWLSKQQYNSADVRNLFRHSAKLVESFENPTIESENSSENPQDAESGIRFRKVEGRDRYDRDGNLIGDGSWHVPYEINDIALSYPNITYKVHESASTESVYVTYYNNDPKYSESERPKVTVRFSNHTSNAVAYGDQLVGVVGVGETAKKYSTNLLLVKLGLKKEVPVRRKLIDSRAVSNKVLNSDVYEEADKTIQELYNLPVGADISQYKGKLAKGSRYLILGDKVKEGEIVGHEFEDIPEVEKLRAKQMVRELIVPFAKELREEKVRLNNAIDTAVGFILGSKELAKKRRLKREADRKELAKEIYSSVLKGDFNDVTLSQIDKFIEDATPANPFGRRISQRLPQRMERALRQGARTNAVDALFSRISESAVPANERFSEAGRREIEERKKELLKGWAIATGNWHTDLKEFTDDTEPIGEGKDSKVYSSKDGRYVIKASKGKPYGKRFRPDIDNIALFNDVFRDTRYEILGYGEIDGEFVRILQQPIVDFAQSTPLTSEERREYMQSLGFEPLNDANTAFADGEIVIADLQKGNVVRDAAGNISVIDADAKLHTKDVGGDYTYPPVEEDLPEDSGTRFRITPEMDAEYMAAVENGDMETAERLVKEAATNSGYTIEAYHGTPNSVYNPDWENAVAEIYAILFPDKARINPNAEIFSEESRRFFDFANALRIEYNHIKNKLPRQLQVRYERGQKTKFTVFDRQKRGSSTGARDAKKGFFFSPDEDFARSFTQTFEMDPFTKIITKVSAGYGNMYKVFIKPDNLLDLRKYPADKSKSLQQGDTAGYDVVINKVKDGRDKNKVKIEIMVTKPELIKSADTVTYDDSGNIIPLSERFNEEKEDIRFRITDTDRQALEFKRQHKGSTNIVVIDTDALVPELVVQGFTAEEVQEIRDFYKKGVQGFYDRKRKTIYLLGKDHSEKENSATLWHESTHKAIGDMDFPQELMDEFYTMPSKRFIDFFEGKAKEFYEPEEYAEELIAYFVEEAKKDGDNFDDAVKTMETSAENVERLKEIVEPIINYINHGRQTNEGTGRRIGEETEGNDRGMVQETIGNGNVESLSEGARTEAEGAGETRFSTRGEGIDNVPTQPLTLMERITNSLLEVSAKNKENLGLRASALRTFGRDINRVLSLMKAQREYDKSTVDTLVKLAKMYFQNAQLLGEVTPYEVARIMGVLNRMARMFTSQNPAFIVTNLSRDIIWAGTVVATKENPEYVKMYTKNITKALAKGQLPILIHKFQKGTLDADNELERYFIEFMENGGETGFTQINTVEDYKRNIKRFMKEAKDGVNITTKAWRGVWGGVEFLNRSAEDTTRFMVYMTSRQMGRTVAQSIWDAKEVTVNFNKKGSGEMGAKYLNFAYIFFNATMQALSNFGKLIVKHPGRTTAALSIYSALGFFMPMINAAIVAMFGGDEEDYWDLPEWVRRNNIVMFAPWTEKGFITILLPHELRPFYGMGEAAYSALAGKEDVEDAIYGAMNGFTGLLPLDYTGNGGNALVNITPTIFQPYAQVKANVDYFGKPIYRDNPFNENAPEWTKAYKGTNRWLVGAAEWLNMVTGGNEVKRGLINLNPAVVEHLIEGYTGGLGKTVNKTWKTISMLWDEDVREARNIPVISSFYQESDERSSGSRLNREYFEALEELKDAQFIYSGYRKRAESGSKEYQELLEEFVNSKEFRRLQIIKNSSGIIKQLDDILKDRPLTEEQEKAIKDEITYLKTQMLNTLEDLEEEEPVEDVKKAS